MGASVVRGGRGRLDMVGGRGVDVVGDEIEWAGRGYGTIGVVDKIVPRVAVRVAELIESGQTSGPAFQEAVDSVDALDIAAVLALSGHSDARVRRDVAATVPMLCGGGRPTEAMVEVAIRLASDEDMRVRDWACLALGTQWIDVDTTAVREALAARLDDIDRDTRCEALVGLAYRRDPRAFSRVRQALARPSGNVSRLEMVAAGALSDPRLHNLVQRHQSGWEDAASGRTAYLASLLTDPAGPSEDILGGVAEMYRRRAHGRPLGSTQAAWRTMQELLEIAPHRAPEFLDRVLSRVAGDEATTEEVREMSALAQDAGD